MPLPSMYVEKGFASYQRAIQIFFGVNHVTLHASLSRTETAGRLATLGDSWLNMLVLESLLPTEDPSEVKSLFARNEVLGRFVMALIGHRASFDKHRLGDMFEQCLYLSAQPEAVNKWAVHPPPEGVERSRRCVLALKRWTLCKGQEAPIADPHKFTREQLSADVALFVDRGTMSLHRTLGTLLSGTGPIAIRSRGVQNVAGLIETLCRGDDAVANERRRRRVERALNRAARGVAAGGAAGGGDGGGAGAGVAGGDAAGAVMDEAALMRTVVEAAAKNDDDDDDDVEQAATSGGGAALAPIVRAFQPGLPVAAGGESIVGVMDPTALLSNSVARASSFSQTGGGAGSVARGFLQGSSVSVAVVRGDGGAAADASRSMARASRARSRPGFVAVVEGADGGAVVPSADAVGSPRADDVPSVAADRRRPRDAEDAPRSPSDSADETRAAVQAAERFVAEQLQRMISSPSDDGTDNSDGRAASSSSQPLSWPASPLNPVEPVVPAHLQPRFSVPKGFRAPAAPSASASASAPAAANGASSAATQRRRRGGTFNPVTENGDEVATTNVSNANNSASVLLEPASSQDAHAIAGGSQTSSANSFAVAGSNSAGTLVDSDGFAVPEPLPVARQESQQQHLSSQGALPDAHGSDDAVAAGSSSSTIAAQAPPHRPARYVTPSASPAALDPSAGDQRVPHWRVPITVTWATRQGRHPTTTPFFPCCGLSFDTRRGCMLHPAAGRWHWGTIIQGRQTRTSASKTTVLAHWSCCQRPLVETGQGKQEYRITPECQNGCSNVPPSNDNNMGGGGSGMPRPLALFAASQAAQCARGDSTATDMGEPAARNPDE